MRAIITIILLSISLSVAAQLNPTTRINPGSDSLQILITRASDNRLVYQQLNSYLIDQDSTNELQILSFSNPNLSISGGNSVNLSGIDKHLANANLTAFESRFHNWGGNTLSFANLGNFYATTDDGELIFSVGSPSSGYYGGLTLNEGYLLLSLAEQQTTDREFLLRLDDNELSLNSKDISVGGATEQIALKRQNDSTIITLLPSHVNEPLNGKVLTAYNNNGDATWTDLPAGSDDQTLTFASPNLSIEDGNSVNLSGLLNGYVSVGQYSPNFVTKWQQGVTDRLTISTLYDDGSIGVGTTSPNARLNVIGTGNGSSTNFLSQNSGNAPLFSVKDDGRIGIGTNLPNSNTILDINSTSKAIRLPRLSTTSRDALSGLAGMLLFNSTTDKLNFHDGTAWVETASSADVFSGLYTDLDFTGTTGLSDGIDNVDDADASATNELQNLSNSISGNNVTIEISNGTNTTFSRADGDASATNELQTISKTGSTVTLSDGGGSFTDAVNDADASATNELQNLSNSITGNNVTIQISNGTNTTFSRADGDASANNEVVTDFSVVNGGDISLTEAGSNTTLSGASFDNQTLSFSSPNLSILDGNSVNLSTINTDNQTLSFSNPDLSISGGNSVDLSALGGTDTNLGNSNLTANAVRTFTANADFSIERSNFTPFLSKSISTTIHGPPNGDFLGRLLMNDNSTDLSYGTSFSANNININSFGTSITTYNDTQFNLNQNGIYFNILNGTGNIFYTKAGVTPLINDVLYISQSDGVTGTLELGPVPDDGDWTVDSGSGIVYNLNDKIGIGTIPQYQFDFAATIPSLGAFGRISSLSGTSFNELYFVNAGNGELDLATSSFGLTGGEGISMGTQTGNGNTLDFAAIGGKGRVLYAYDNGVIRLTPPVNSNPDYIDEGSIYYDDNEQIFKWTDGVAWYDFCDCGPNNLTPYASNISNSDLTNINDNRAFLLDGYDFKIFKRADSIDIFDAALQIDTTKTVIRYNRDQGMILNDTGVEILSNSNDGEGVYYADGGSLSLYHRELTDSVSLKLDEYASNKRLQYRYNGMGNVNGKYLKGISNSGYAEWSDLPPDSDNQNLSNSVAGNNVTVQISNGTNTTFSRADGDASATNEIQTLSFANPNLSISGAGGNSVNLSALSDNLGNHIATQNIQLGANWLSGDGDNEGISIAANGHITATGTSLTTGRFNISGNNGTPGILVQGEDNIWFDAGQVRITTHDGYGNFAIKTGADNDDKYVGAGAGALKILLQEFGSFQVFSAPSGTIGNLISWNTGLVQNSLGNVGIGTAGPLQDLHLRGTGIERILVESTDNQAGISFKSDGDGEVVIYSPDSSNDISLYTGGTDRVRVKNTGDVGIGTTAPAAKLEVNGSMRWSGQTGTNAKEKYEIHADSDGDFVLVNMKKVQSLTMCPSKIDLSKGEHFENTFLVPSNAGYGGMVIDAVEARASSGTGSTIDLKLYLNGTLQSVYNIDNLSNTTYTTNDPTTGEVSVSAGDLIHIEYSDNASSSQLGLTYNIIFKK